MFKAIFIATLISLIGLTGCGSESGLQSTGNDLLPLLSILDASVVEGSSEGVTGLNFEVTMSRISSEDVVVGYMTLDGDAFAPGDYTPVAATLTIPAGSSSAFITVSILADTLYEHQYEAFSVVLSNPVNAELGRETATATIYNDDIGGMNDTGITQSAGMGEDADSGRDADMTRNSDVDGHAGFSFAKLDAQGASLANQATAYDMSPWSCVQDLVTGLVWEVKEAAGSGSLRDASKTYSWYSATALNHLSSSPDAESYVTEVNEENLCGHHDWRLPTLEELRSIVDYSIAYPGPTIDRDYFPNTQSGLYWTSDLYVGMQDAAWLMSFRGAYDMANFKSLGYNVRLVRSAI